MGAAGKGWEPRFSPLDTSIPPLDKGYTYLCRSVRRTGINQSEAIRSWQRLSLACLLGPFAIPFFSGPESMNVGRSMSLVSVLSNGGAAVLRRRQQRDHRGGSKLPFVPVATSSAVPSSYRR
jgi:hypothetical protein